MHQYQLTLLGALLAFAPLCGHCQQTSQESVPEANPGRPTVSTPATLTPVGYLQFENGGQYAENTTEFDRQFSINQVTRLSVTSRFQLLALSEPFAYSRIGTNNSSEPGDVSLGFQAVALTGNQQRPTISVSYYRRIYGGAAPDIDTGSFRQSALVLVSGDRWGFHADLNGIVSEQIAVPVHRAQFGQTLSISHPAGKFTVSGEFWHFSQPLTRGNAIGNLWAVSYSLHKNLVFDAGFEHGFTSTSTKWEEFAGFTYLLPHLLWKKRG